MSVRRCRKVLISSASQYIYVGVDGYLSANLSLKQRLHDREPIIKTVRRCWFMDASRLRWKVGLMYCCLCSDFITVILRCRVCSKRRRSRPAIFPDHMCPTTVMLFTFLHLMLDHQGFQFFADLWIFPPQTFPLSPDFLVFSFSSRGCEILLVFSWIFTRSTFPFPLWLTVWQVYPLRLKDPNTRCRWYTHCIAHCIAHCSLHCSLQCSLHCFL